MYYLINTKARRQNSLMFLCVWKYVPMPWLDAQCAMCFRGRALVLASEERVRQLQIRVHSNRTSAASASSQQDLNRALKNKREVRPMSSISRAVLSSLSFFILPGVTDRQTQRWQTDTGRDPRRSPSENGAGVGRWKPNLVLLYWLLSHLRVAKR